MGLSIANHLTNHKKNISCKDHKESVTNLKIPFFKPNIDEATISAVAEVLRSGWLTTGPKTLEFEEKFADYLGAKHAVMLNSATAALHLSLEAIGIKEGDEVITTPFTFAATAEVIEYFNAKPVLVDVHDDTLNINETLIEEKITSRTRAIIPVHYGGHPCEMDAIMSIARKHNLFVIEDAAHCTPAYFKNKPIGTIGDITCFSFYANKCITTGEGGMITTRKKRLADKIRILRLHGLSKDAANRYSKKAAWKYDIIAKGYKYNPTDISAAIGIHQLTKADMFWRKRKKIVQMYIHLLKNIPNLKLPVELEHVQSSWHLFPIRLVGKLKYQRDEFITELSRQGVAASVHFIPLHIHPYYRKKYNYLPNDFPVSYASYKGLITLPVYPSLSIKNVRLIANRLLKTIDTFQ